MKINTLWKILALICLALGGIISISGLFQQNSLFVQAGIILLVSAVYANIEATSCEG